MRVPDLRRWYVGASLGPPRVVCAAPDRSAADLGALRDEGGHDEREREHEADRDDHGDRREGQDHVAAPTLPPRNRRLQRPPGPFGAGDRSAVDDREEAAKSEDEREDEEVRARERDEQDRVPGT